MNDGEKTTTHKLVIDDSGYLFVAERGTRMDFNDLVHVQSSEFTERKVKLTE